MLLERGTAHVATPLHLRLRSHYLAFRQLNESDAAVFSNGLISSSLMLGNARHDAFVSSSFFYSWYVLDNSIGKKKSYDVPENGLRISPSAKPQPFRSPNKALAYIPYSASLHFSYRAIVKSAGSVTKNP